MPPAASTGIGATASTTSGHSTMLPTSPVWPPPFGSLAHDEVEASRLVIESMLYRAGQGPDQTPAVLHLLHHVGGRCAERVGDQSHVGVAEGAVEETLGVGRRPTDHSVGLPLTFGDLGHAVIGQDLEGEVLVLGWDQPADLGLELLRVHLVHALVLGRNHDVDAVGAIADVLVDPRELDLQLFGAEADGAEHADAAGVGDSGDHVAAVGEGENRELDAQRAADFGVHV